MEVLVAKTAGFCFGVERAVRKVYEQIGTGHGPICTLGPIIHNEEVVKDLEEKGGKGRNVIVESPKKKKSLVKQLPYHPEISLVKMYTLNTIPWMHSVKQVTVKGGCRLSFHF